MATSTIPKLGFWITTGLLCVLCLGCGWGDLGGAQGVGRPCDLQVAAGPSQGVYNSAASECPGKLCIKPVVEPGASGTVDTGPTCSGECGGDSDCQGELRDPTNPSDNRCAKGFACAVPFVKGPLCCKKLCVCKDFLGPAGATTPIACQGSGAMSCWDTASEPPAGSVTGAGVQTDLYVNIAPIRQIDIVTMVDNSPSMAPKIEKLNTQFGKLITALRDPVDGTLPDLRVAIIDSDLGTGGAYSTGSCGPRTLADGIVSPYGDLGRFQMPVLPTPCPITPGSRFLEYKSGAPLNYTSDIGAVFSCLTSNLGTAGCDLEHQLQAFEFALAAQGIGNEVQQAAFLRPNAQLGLILLSDEDDCSAATNDGLFGDKPELRGESASLRCATRAHMCGGINLDTSLPGYPTSAAFVHPFADCQARADACPLYTDTAVPTQCSPLRDFRLLADEILALKADSGQILVAGIFGWPMTDADMASAEYKIAPIPNPNPADPAHPTVFNYWPVCYDPNHLPSPATTDPVTGFDATAAAWGATGGLRESAFIDRFGANGLKFSICEPDFSNAMVRIGSALARQLQNLCFADKLIDIDLATAGIQADCRVVWRVPVQDAKDPTRVVYAESPTALPQCAADAINGSVSEDCWQLSFDPSQCPGSGQGIHVLRTQAELTAQPQLNSGTKLLMQCRTCPAAPAGSAVVAGCDY